MDSTKTFFAGLLLLVLFGWYFFTDSERAKRWLGTVLTVLIVAFCVALASPPKEKIHLGLDLQGGTSFLIRLDPPLVDGDKKAVTKDMVEQAMEAIRKRVDAYGVSEPIITPQGEDRILTVPNGLTLIRLLCLPVFVWLLTRPHRAGWYPAALLLAGLGVTDGVDGYVARHFHQVSTLD